MVKLEERSILMGTVFILLVYAIVYIGKILIEHLFLKDPPGKQRISGRCQKDQRRAECCQQAERSQHHQKQQTLSKWSNAMAPDCNTVFLTGSSNLAA